MLEKQLEMKLRDRVKSLGGIAYKFESPGNNGVPDRIVVLPIGRIYFIEMKKPKNSITAERQKYQQARLREKGADVRTIFTEEELSAFLEEVSK